MKHTFMWLVPTALAISVVGCGGGGSSKSSSDASASATSSGAPIVGSSRLYALTTVDNSNNTINQSAKYTINSVNADGSLTETETDPNNNSVTVNGRVYSIGTAVETLNSSRQLLETKRTNTAGTTTCEFSPHGAGVPRPIVLGSTWSFQFTQTCGSNGPVTVSQNGQVLDQETVTVPAGTFTTYKVQSTLTDTVAGGTTLTETITNWIDVVTGFSVKETITYSYTGTLPTGAYTVSTSRSLQSLSSGS